MIYVFDHTSVCDLDVLDSVALRLQQVPCTSVTPRLGDGVKKR